MKMPNTNGIFKGLLLLGLWLYQSYFINMNTEETWEGVKRKNVSWLDRFDTRVVIPRFRKTMKHQALSWMMKGTFRSWKAFASWEDFLLHWASKACAYELLHSSHCLRMSENKETTFETLSNLPVNHKYRISERIRTHLYILWASLAAQMVRNPPTMQETLVPSLGWDDAMEKGMANHPSILAWRVPWTEEPGGLQSMGSRGVRHNWANTIFTLCFV